MHIVHIPDPIINLLVSVIQHNMNIPKNNRKIIRKMMNFRIEILPKEAPLGLKMTPPPRKKIEGCAETCYGWVL